MPMLQPLRREAHGCSTVSTKLHYHVAHSSLIAKHGWPAAIDAELMRPLQRGLDDRTDSYTDLS